MNLKSWIVNREQIGKPCFSRDGVAASFPMLSPNAIDSSLSRFRANGLVAAVHRGCYCVIPAHYALEGELPPQYYVDSLMRWIGKPYYLALQTAAALWGAGHQKVMKAQVMTELPQPTTSMRKNPSIIWLYRKSVPLDFVVRRNGENGQVSYSNPELTAVDLVRYADRAGGMSFVATVLSELRETTNFSGAGTGVFRTAGVADIQRLGYIYDEILDDEAQADTIYAEMMRLGARIRPVALAPSLTVPSKTMNKRWRIKVNYEIEEVDT